MTESQIVFPSIDYDRHPAFREFVVADPCRESSIAAQIAQLDAVLDELRATAGDTPAVNVAHEYARRALPLFDELAEICLASLPREIVITKIAADAFAETRDELCKELLYHHGSKSRQRAGKAFGRSEQVAEELRRDGLSLHSIPPQTIRRINDSLGQYRADLIELSQRNGGVNCAIALPHAGAYWSEIVRFLTSQGILQACSDCRGEPLEVAFCGLIFSHEREQWWKGCYEDVGIPRAQTGYMHNDKDYAVMKVLVYLSEVDESRGPFCFIRGSHDWRRSRVRSFFFKALDSASYAVLPPLEPVASAYHRKAFRHPEFRRQLMQVPGPLRGTSHFGDDVLDGTELSRWLLERETVITSEMANCAVFIGADGIHRGGCVQTGERWAFQIGLKRVPRVGQRIERTAKAAYGLARAKAGRAVRRIVGENRVQAIRSLTQRVVGR